MLSSHDHDPCGPIVVADDSEDDIYFLQRHLAELGVTAPVVVLRDGYETIEHLRSVARSGHGEPLPSILFLDLRMPRATGFSVLCWLREQPELADLKVVILSDSEDPCDVALAAELEADAFVAKQPDAEALSELLQRFAPAVLAPHHVPA